MSFKNYLAVALLSLCSVVAMAQNKRISGKVVDANGDPVIGAGITQVGTTNGVVTDFEGNYVFNVPDGATINVEALGFDPQQFRVVAGQNVYNITLGESATELDETVVIGYGTQRKRLITGSTINVSGDLIQKQQTTNAIGALYSSVPGVNIVQSNGQPWSGYTITVRGLGTTGSSSPLYVIDGVAGGSISSLNPADIESIDILKDAASSAIYGARAANGVILVTTKQGKRDSKVNVTFDASWGIQEAHLNGVHAVGAKEYIDLVNKAFVSNGTIKEGETYPEVDEKLFPVQAAQMRAGTWDGTDWLKESVNKNAPTNNYVIGMNGGNDLVRFSLSYSKSYTEGTLGYPKKTYYDRNTIRANTDYSIVRRNGRDILKFGENATFSIYNSNGVSTGNIYSNTIHTALTYTPLLPAYNADGSFYTYQDQLRDNWDARDGAYNLLESYTYGESEGKNYRLQSNAYLEYTPTRAWRIRSMFGYRFNASFSRSYTPVYVLSGTNENEFDDVSQSGSVSNSYTWENTVSWTKQLADHNLEALVGASIEGTKWGMSVNGNRQQTRFNTWESANLSSSDSEINSAMVGIGGSNTIPYNDLVSFFGRINYNYKDTYLLTLIAREDGSKNFASGHRWGFFPSASAGWIVTNEDFMDWSRSFMDYFKLRASWGQNGNCSINNFQYAATVSLSAPYDFTHGGTATQTGAYPSIIPNTALTWETTEQTDLGFDARFFKSRLGVTFDWYRKDTKDWLVNAPTLKTYGTGAPVINGGAVRNQGVELSLTWNDRIGDFMYSIGVNGSHNTNKILYINNAEGIIHGGTNVIAQNISSYNTFEARTGMPIGYFAGFASEGIFQNQKQIDDYNAAGYTFMDGYAAAQPGDVIWIDQNKDGKYDDDDVVEIGNPHPDYNVGLNLSMQWKGIDFSLSGSGAFGQQVLQSYRSFANSDIENYANNFVARLWTGEGSTNSFPRFTYGKHNNFYAKGYVGDIWAFDADYFKIRTITFGYDLKSAIKALPMSSLRLYFTGQNLFTFTKYDGMDPEVGYGYGYSWTSGIDIGYYPSPKVYMFGVSIKF